MTVLWAIALSLVSLISAQIIGISTVTCDEDHLAVDIGQSPYKGPYPWPIFSSDLNLRSPKGVAIGPKYSSTSTLSSLDCITKADYDDALMSQHLAYQYWGMAFHGQVELDEGVTATMNMAGNWSDSKMPEVIGTVNFTGPISQKFDLLLPFNDTQLSLPGISASTNMKSYFSTPCQESWGAQTSIQLSVDNSKNITGSGKLSVVGDDPSTLFAAISSQSRPCGMPFTVVFAKPSTAPPEASSDEDDDG
jgi:hypothetical protein